MLSNNTMVTLIRLIENPTDSLFTLSVETKKSITELNEDISSINSVLSKNNFPTILITENKYIVPDSIIYESDRIYELFHDNQVSFLPEDRLKILYLFLFSRKNFVSNYHFQELLHVSRNTVLNDINLLRERLSKSKIEILYTRSNGYHLKGEELAKQNLAYFALSKLLDKSIGEWVVNYLLINLEEKNNINNLNEITKKFQKDFEIHGIQIRLYKMLNFLQFILIRFRRDIDDSKLVSKKNFVGNTNISILVDSLLDAVPTYEQQINETKKLYIELLFLGCFEEELEKNKEKYFENIVEEIVIEMERLSLLNFTNRDEMLSGLKNHLIPAYYRIILGFPDSDDNTSAVIDNNRELFDIVKKALNPLRKLLDTDIPDNEIAYFMIHFGGHIQRYNVNQSKVKALIVCPNGISSSLILKDQLSVMFPDIKFLNIHRLNEVYEIDKDKYDIIFSTVNLNTKKPLFVIPLRLDVEEREELVEYVHDELPVLKARPSKVNEIYNLVEANATIHNESKIRLGISKILYNKDNLKGEESPMLHDLIIEETFQFTDDKLEWKDAFHKAAEPLLQNGSITESYVESMISKVEEFGPFINLGKGVAIPHARPEDGVEELGMSMLVLDHPIFLPQDDSPVEILIVIAAVDNETHLSALSHLSTILREDENVQKLKNARKYDEIESVIYQGGEK